ncbi:MAG: hypothetical protein JST20_03680, partial [Bacteroidetes bacterium]|nr:hypothetical protein [Bacteroidota bacterium]
MANEIPKNYNMSHAELSVYANQLVTFMLRDLDDFAKFGITTTQTDALQALQDAFQEIPTDEKYQSDATTARVIRDEARELLIDKMDDIALRFRLAFPEGHSPLNQFDISDLSGVDDSNVLLKARNLNSKLPLYTAQLLPHGQTPTVTTEFEETVQDFEDKIRAHISAISKRTQGTEDRTKAGNYLYEFVVDYTDMGKRLYQKKSPAKYQDYIIYGSTPAVAVHGAPSGLHFLDETTLSWTEIDNATSYGVSVSSDGGSHWQADIFTSANYTNVPILSVGKLYYRVRGRNSVGYG